MRIRRWLLPLAVLIYLGLVWHSAYLVVLPVALLVIFILASWWQRYSLDGVIYKRRFLYTRAFPGEIYPLKIEIENRKLLPLSWLRIQDPWPEAVAPEDESVLAPSHVADQGVLTHVLSLRWFERSRRSYNLVFRKRGVYKVGPAEISSGDLFGLFDRSGTIGQPEKLTVFPELLPVGDMELPPEKPFGDQRSRRRLFEDPNRPMGVREYHPEDSFRRVHWPATAHTNTLQVKIFQPTSAQMMVLCLNVATFKRYWEGIYPALLERLISVAGTLLSRGMDLGYRVGMISNGCLSNSDQPFRIPPGRSPKQKAHLLEALAGVTPIVVAPFERYLIREIPRVPYGSTLMILTAITSPELAETLLKLKRHERQLTLVSLAEDPPPKLFGIRCVHMPVHDKEEFVRDYYEIYQNPGT
ncbi:MAG: DUF58 domain-containing protein [Chloroflexi bacterium]|nr:DUF58 domain-containing protein [Chloroflexota bacterium]